MAYNVKLSFLVNGHSFIQYKYNFDNYIYSRDSGGKCNISIMNLTTTIIIFCGYVFKIKRTYSETWTRDKQLLAKDYNHQAKVIQWQGNF